MTDTDIETTETLGCTWLVPVSISELCPADCECEGTHGEIWAEARGELTRDCGAPVTVTDRGWSCEAGHEHVTMEARFNEGWDYFDDDEIAAVRSGGTFFGVGMRDMAGREAF